ncbi:MAG TPA: GNAT family N-acetyltransferase [Vicinamibacterales bacterium]|nr:GNAT family N-acetyltransferase [Vicinamibacterales bacterium]
MEFSVRDVEPSDAAGLVRVLNPIIEARCYTVLDRPVSVETEFDYIIDFQDRGIWKVAVREPDYTIVGFQVLEPYASYTRAFDHVGILGTYVDLDLRRQGIARRLFAATFDAAREKGYEKIFTFVRADNPAALQTYLGQGFVVVGNAKRQAKIDGQYIDEILIEKWL